MDTTRDQLAAYIQRKLGSHLWTVELSDLDLIDAIEDAIRLYARWKPIEKHLTLTSLPGITRITNHSTPALPAGTTGLLDCSIITNLVQGNPNIEAQMLSGTFAFYGVRSPLYDLRFYEYQRQWIRFAGKELSSEPEYAFRLNEDTTEPEFWVYSPGMSVNVDAIFGLPHTTLATIPSFDEDRIRKLSLAAAKITLGHNRSKFKGIPAANQVVQLDGLDMVHEGREEWDEEEKKLRSSVSDQIMIWL